MGCWGENSPAEAAGAKALRARDLKCLKTICWFCIAGAFIKFAIFESLIFLKRGAAE